jgi:uncharacterized RDD family membrane protein YckC
VHQRLGDGPRFAGFWIRAVAAAVDLVVVALAQYSLGVVAGVVWGRQVEPSPPLRSTIAFFTLVFAVLYTAVLHAGPGQTVGKLLVGVRVVGLDGRPLGFGPALLRSLAGLLSLLPLGAGFLMAGLRRDKRALHDLLAGSRVEWVPRGGRPVSSERRPELEAPAVRA